MLVAQESFEAGEYSDAIEQLTSRYIASRAEALLLPIPACSEETYEYSAYDGGCYLKRDQRAKLHEEVRRVEKDNWDHWNSRITLIIGLLGAVSGLAAVVLG